LPKELFLGGISVSGGVPENIGVDWGYNSFTGRFSVAGGDTREGKEKEGSIFAGGGEGGEEIKKQCRVKR